MITRNEYSDDEILKLLSERIAKQSSNELVNTANMLLAEQVAFLNGQTIELINWEEALAILGSLKIEVIKTAKQNRFLWRVKDNSVTSDVDFDTFKTALCDAIQSNLAAFNRAIIALNKAMNWDL
jgi:hypothetical protein